MGVQFQKRMALDPRAPIRQTPGSCIAPGTARTLLPLESPSCAGQCPPLPREHLSLWGGGLGDWVSYCRELTPGLETLLLPLLLFLHQKESIHTICFVMDATGGRYAE